MPRALRIAPAGVCFHVLNRGGNRHPLFRKDADYAAFAAVVAEAAARFEVDLFCWCLMPDYWHLVLRPRTGTALIRFMAWLSVTHVRRHHVRYRSFSGRLYQGRYKSFPVEDDEHFLMLCRYVEASPLRAKLVRRAERWAWSSLGQREGGGDEPALAAWPVNRPRNWKKLVNQPPAEQERELVEKSLRRQCPLGSDRWSGRVAKKLDLNNTLNPRGRPRKPLAALSNRQRQRRENEDGQSGR